MKYVRRAIAILVPLLMIGGLVWAYLERQNLYDWWQLRNYSAPAAVARLAMDDTMTDQARHIFYVNHPNLITDKFKFQQACTQTEQTIVLGCYHGSQSGIDIYNVKDSRLAGVAEVTAGHEMLHAAYDRLSPTERNQVNGWLNDFYKTVKDKRIIKTVNLYKKTEPNDVVNEMHSIFGTEAGKLPKPLENYYKRYFTNRSKIVAYSDAYEKAFESRQAQIDALSKQLTVLAKRVKALNSALLAQKKELDYLYKHVRTQADADAYESKRSNYNRQVGVLNNMIENYNSLRSQYGQLVLQQEELFNAINTKSLSTQSAR